MTDVESRTEMEWLRYWDEMDLGGALKGRSVVSGAKAGCFGVFPSGLG
jgi:hypothetical protein